MKKSLLFLSLFIAGMTSVNAQCTIANSCTPSTNTGYCSTPAVGTALPNGTENVAYSTTIQVSLGTTAGGGFATITDATVTAINGLPAGVTATPNPASGVIPAGTDACILISGTPAAGSAGTYTVDAAVTVSTNFGNQNANLVWPLTIDPAVGIAEVSANSIHLSIVPNPAVSEATLITDVHFKQARVFDALGNLVMTQDANSTYKTTIDVSKLNAGIYFVQIIEGTKMVTRKFIKE